MEWVHWHLFLLIIGFAAFWKGTHPQSHIETIDPQNVEAHESFKPENLGLHEVEEGKYIVNIVASAFNYDFGKDEDGNRVNTIRVPKGSTVLFKSRQRMSSTAFKLLARTSI